MSLDQSDLNTAFRRSVRDHWRAFLIEGVVLVILGVAAIALPPLAGIAAAIVLGWLFLLGGIVGLIATFNQRNAPGFWWSLFSAAIAVLAGGVLLANPLAGVATLTYVLIAFFVLDGVLIIVMALEHRRELSGRWEWMMLGGVMDLVLAAIIIAGLPGTLAWALGLLVGIDLLWGGITLIAMAVHARDST
ncbi:MAG: HdeD family acid-resistance protein [Alphaproteobacteria bacterium]|nr:HdeD family acid-resistance protein [Alphaproteobacteria bacterium]MBV9551733.1 HdeD family acid-resistance protein [Alphaproteobacteria bacterium]